MIVCLGWGSLIWRPCSLPMVGDWYVDGPMLPIEFARQSRDGRITLVVEYSAEPVPVLWARLGVGSIEDARQGLAEREEICLSKYPRSIGHWSRAGESAHAETVPIGEWARGKGAEGAVWTALKPRFNNKLVTPTCKQVISCLRSLEDPKRRKAEEYVRKAPPQIKTAYRKAIEEDLGWTAMLDEPPG